MQRKKGFTLIELLAVIVILAIIALIVTPLVLNVIDTAKKGAFQSTSYGILDSAEQGYALKSLSEESAVKTIYTYTDGVETKLVGNVDIKYKGSKPQDGKLIVNDDGKIALAFYENNWCAFKDYTDEEITVSQKTKEECVLNDNTVIEYKDPSGANAPILTTGMTAVKWDGSAWVTADTNSSDWYDYSNKKWANAQTADGSMWVWIPRYAYKLISGYHTSTAGEFDIKFLSGDTNQAQDATIINTTGYSTSGTNTSNAYFLHPAFNPGGESIKGFWVAKFEPSGTTTNINILPGVASLRGSSLETMFTSAISMKNNSKYGWLSTEADTHMITDYEWGATSYLTYSSYGKNSEVWINPSSTYITGCAGDGVDAASSSGCSNYYNSTNGMQASTTGNIYGVYDMSGGAMEFTASYVNNSTASTKAPSLVSASNKYKVVYVVSTSGDSGGYDYTANKDVYGNTLYETTNGTSSSAAWNGDVTYFAGGTSPLIARGYAYAYKTQAGIFSYFAINGTGDTLTTFRPTIFVK